MNNTVAEIDRALFATLNILYVEDADFTREALAYYLKRRFNQVDVAGNGKKGLEMFQANPYDVVLTDVMMPVMDGLEMTRQIKALNPAVPVIVISAHSDQDTKQRAAEAGVDEFLVKPFYPEKVCEVVNKYVTAQRQ
jgi:CheY-like chemotaxis protein